MAFVLQGLRRAAAAAGGSVWSAQGSRLMSSSSSLNRLPAQITTPTRVSPSSLQVLLQRVFPLGQPTSKVVTILPAPVPAKPTLVVSKAAAAEIEGFKCLNRNARRGKKANHGKRPVSSARRKQKHRTFGRKNG